MNRKFALSVFIALLLALTSCTPVRTAPEYASRAGELVDSGDKGRALEVLREGIYRYPDDYELNIMMARTILSYYTDLTPRARSRYLARYYLKRAASVAPDMERADSARQEYALIRDMQR